MLSRTTTLLFNTLPSMWIQNKFLQKYSTNTTQRIAQLPPGSHAYLAAKHPAPDRFNKKKMFLSLLQLTFTFQITLKGLGRWLRDKDTCCESKFSPQNLQWWRVPQAGLWHVRACIHKLKRNSTKLFSFKGYLFYCVGISNEIQLVQTRLWKYKIHTELKDLNNGNVLERW